MHAEGKLLSILYFPYLYVLHLMLIRTSSFFIFMKEAWVSIKTLLSSAPPAQSDKLKIKQMMSKYWSLLCFFILFKLKYESLSLLLFSLKKWGKTNKYKLSNTRWRMSVISNNTTNNINHTLTLQYLIICLN